MFANLKLTSGEIVRMVALGLLVIIEGFTVVSVLLNIVFLPLGPFYPNIASAAVLVFPVVIGALSKRYETAIALTVAPFFILALIYTLVYAPVWNVDLFYLGTLAGRVAGGVVLLGALGAFGCMLRRLVSREAPVPSA